MGDIVMTRNPRNVEDVLASIRKLVTDEAQARSRETEKADMDVRKQDILMLTPEQEVSDPPAPPPLKLEVPVPPEDLVEPPQADTPQTVAPEAVAATDVEDAADEAPDEGAEEAPAPFHDEVALRALVSDVVMDVLKGELGTRLTRNLRKMVESEVNKALDEKAQQKAED